MGTYTSIRVVDVAWSQDGLHQLYPRMESSKVDIQVRPTKYYSACGLGDQRQENAQGTAALSLLDSWHGEWSELDVMHDASSSA